MPVMTAQEALEKFGWVLAVSKNPFRAGQVFENKRPGMILLGQQLVVIGVPTTEEVQAFDRATGWETAAPQVFQAKVIAE